MFAKSELVNQSWARSTLLSFLVHGAFLFLLIFRLPFQANLMKPSDVVLGSLGTSTELVYLSRQSLLASLWDSTREPAMLRAPTFQRRPDSSTTRTIVRTTKDDSARAGSPLGSLKDGPTDGLVVQPALPIVGPDVPRSSLPSGIQGSVVVEVTIDTQGNVTATRVLQSLGAEVDDKVVATLQTWHFRPATTDGVASVSKQDVYFHFPS